MIIAFLATLFVACGEKADDSAIVEEVEEVQVEDTSSENEESEGESEEETEEETEDTASESEGVE